MIRASLYLWKMSVMSDEATVHNFGQRTGTAGTVTGIVGMILQQKDWKKELRIWLCRVNKRLQSC